MQFVAKVYSRQERDVVGSILGVKHSGYRRYFGFHVLMVGRVCLGVKVG